MKWRPWAGMVCLAAIAAAPLPHALRLQGDTEWVHDPSAIRAGRTYYVFSTGSAHPGYLPIRCSPDLMHWSACGRVFSEMPAWATREIPGAKSLWAPDISHEDGQYRVYYVVSTFGRNDSAIGLAVNATLDRSSPHYKWIDKGMVIRSHAGRDDWNAIDPNLAVDGQEGNGSSSGVSGTGSKCSGSIVIPESYPLTIPSSTRLRPARMVREKARCD